MHNVDAFLVAESHCEQVAREVPGYPPNRGRKLSASENDLFVAVLTAIFFEVQLPDLGALILTSARK